LIVPITIIIKIQFIDSIWNSMGFFILLSTVIIILVYLFYLLYKKKKNKDIRNGNSQIQTNKNIEKSAAVLPMQSQNQSQIKYIGYTPTVRFIQQEPFYYPIVLMPLSHTAVKFPKKGKTERAGYTEKMFKSHIIHFFNNDFEVLDNQVLSIKNGVVTFEPDLILIHNNNEQNIIIDIEIDEPYEGSNNIKTRNPTHFTGADDKRNTAFTQRGWIVIRFAEIQVHQSPEACCRFIAEVIQSISPSFNISESLSEINFPAPIPQWSMEKAKQWSNEKYRENYLGIDTFNEFESERHSRKINETEFDNIIEENIKILEDDKLLDEVQTSLNPVVELLKSIKREKNFVSFIYQGKSTIVEPINVNKTQLTAFCFVKNSERNFNLNEISDISEKPLYYTLKIENTTKEAEKVKNAIKSAIDFKNHVRMRYTRNTWTDTKVDRLTGEIIENTIEAEESLRTIHNIQFSVDALSEETIASYELNQNHITAFCNKREEQRTFRIDRISTIEILDI
jgi:hypothetical protein